MIWTHFSFYKELFCGLLFDTHGKIISLTKFITVRPGLKFHFLFAIWIGTKCHLFHGLFHFFVFLIQPGDEISFLMNLTSVCSSAVYNSMNFAQIKFAWFFSIRLRYNPLSKWQAINAKEEHISSPSRNRTAQQLTYLNHKINSTYRISPNNLENFSKCVFY